jgi:DNA-binding NarL/FixJ family response regulator
VEQGIAVIAEAADYTELLAKIKESALDVVVMDVHMPGLNDLASFKDKLLGTCVLAMSFWSGEEIRVLAESFGAVTLLDKTKLTANLAPAIRECMRQKQTSS